MKKVLILLFIFISSIGFSQKAYVEPAIVEQSNLWWMYGQQSYEYIQEVVIDDNYVPQSQRECLVSRYNTYIGTREKGNNAGAEVEYFLSVAGLSKGNPWCASFIYAIFKECDRDFKLSAPGWVPSWFPQKKLIFVRGKMDIKPPQAGDLIGIWFANKNRLAHIGFYESEDNEFITSVEGNTNEAGSREGDGVYRKKRIKRTIHSISSWLP